MLQTSQYTKIVEQAVQDYLRQASAEVAASPYAEILRANPGRVQGGLVLCGYKREGGQDMAMIQRAAVAIELLHAYVQCLDQAIAVDQALRAAHEAQIILVNLETDPENRLKALSITNRTLMLAAMTRNPQAAEKDVLHWRATEAALTPIHVGQVLAGADCVATNAVTAEALALGNTLVQGS